MPSDPVTVWLGQLQAGDPAAARPLFDKYFARLVGLARVRLRGAPRRAADYLGRFPDLDPGWLAGVLAASADRNTARHASPPGGPVPHVPG